MNLARILVVDDNAEVRMLVRSTLERAGHQVLEAASGEECLDKLGAGERPQLILLDIMMPEMDGWEVSRRIKKDEELKSIIICMLTAKDTTMDALMSIESAKANWHLNKPISRSKLLETVEWLLTNPEEASLGV